MKRVWPVLLASGLGLALLLWLGFWQLERLAWKNALIADLAKRLQEPALQIEPSLFEDSYGVFPTKLPEQTKIKATGQFLTVAPYRMIATTNGGPGWRILHPFKTDNGVYIYVDRGVWSENASLPEQKSTIEIQGIVARHDKGKGFFDPENDVMNNKWYWWDWYSLSHDLGEKLSSEAPFVDDFAFQLLPGSKGSEGLDVQPPKAYLKNNHLGYAITWFGLAAVLVVMTTIFLYQSRHSKRAHNAVE